MMAKLIVSLSLVVATLVAITWSFEGQEAIQQPVTNNVDTVTRDQADIAKINPELEDDTPQDQQLKFNNFVDELNRVIQEPEAARAISRAQAIERLQSKFRLLEAQYGVLSVDDIQALEASLGDIEKLDNLVDLSNALDTLVSQ